MLRRLVKALKCVSLQATSSAPDQNEVEKEVLTEDMEAWIWTLHTSTPQPSILWSVCLDGELVLFVSCSESHHIPFVGTAETRNMAHHNHEASSSKSFKASVNSVSSSWSNCNTDLLYSIMMQLGVVDYYSFSRVCKSWRSLALAHRKKFMESRQPMLISFATNAKKDCYLEDFVGRKFKTILPHSTGTTCFGVTSGHVILFRRRTRDFWLVNPLTRNELHFPDFPFYVSTDPTSIRGVLVFSNLMSRWVFVISHRFSGVISISSAGNQASWTNLSSNFPFHDLHYFKGKIYTINKGGRLYEVRLDPQPSLRLVGMKNFPEPELLRPEFVSSGENLYVMNHILKDVYDAHEVDFDKMGWVSTEKTIGEYALFVSDLKSSAAINPDTWVDPSTQYERFSYLHATDKSKNEGRWFTANIWYFPHHCLDKNILQ